MPLHLFTAHRGPGCCCRCTQSPFPEQVPCNLFPDPAGERGTKSHCVLKPLSAESRLHSCVDEMLHNPGYAAAECAESKKKKKISIKRVINSQSRGRRKLGALPAGNGTFKHFWRDVSRWISTARQLSRRKNKQTGPTNSKNPGIMLQFHPERQHHISRTRADALNRKLMLQMGCFP